MGPFTQEDPIGLAGGLNLYGYANGDPVNFSDPFGLAACDDGDSDCRKGFWAAVVSFAKFQMRGFQAGLDPAKITRGLQADEGAIGAAFGQMSLVAGVTRTPSFLRASGTAASGRVVASAALQSETRVTRWMGQAEYEAMKGSGTLQYGAGNRTSVTSLGAPRPGGTGGVRVDFNVPTGALKGGGRADWYLIFRGNVPITGITRIH